MDSNDVVRVTVSIGVATFPNDARNKKELIDRADAALYKAKRGGKNAVVSTVHTPPMRASSPTETPAAARTGPLTAARRESRGRRTAAATPPPRPRNPRRSAARPRSGARPTGAPEDPDWTAADEVPSAVRDRDPQRGAELPGPERGARRGRRIGRLRRAQQNGVGDAGAR